MISSISMMMGHRFLLKNIWLKSRHDRTFYVVNLKVVVKSLWQNKYLRSKG